MSYTTLTYVQMMRLYYKRCLAELKCLPKGTYREAAAILRDFMDAEKETLRYWYYALQLHLLKQKDFKLLLKQRSAALQLKHLKKHGIPKIQIEQLKVKLLILLVDFALNYSGADLGKGRPRFKMRIYTLPEPMVYNKQLQEYIN